MESEINIGIRGSQIMSSEEYPSGMDEQLESLQPLVYHFAKLYGPALYKLELFDDAVQEAQIAAIRAVKNYNPDKGAKLSTFAYRAINGAYIEVFRKQARELQPAASIYATNKQNIEDDPNKNPEQSVLGKMSDEDFLASFVPGHRSWIESCVLNGMSYTEFAERKGITQSRASQIKVQVRNIMKKRTTSNE